jgi:hypothetical protein
MSLKASSPSSGSTKPTSAIRTVGSNPTLSANYNCNLLILLRKITYHHLQPISLPANWPGLSKKGRRVFASGFHQSRLDVSVSGWLTMVSARGRGPGLLGSRPDRGCPEAAQSSSLNKLSRGRGKARHGL